MLSCACFLWLLVSLITIGFGVAFFLDGFFDFFGISMQDLVFAASCQAYSVDGQIKVPPRDGDVGGKRFSGHLTSLSRLGHLHLMLLRTPIQISVPDSSNLVETIIPVLAIDSRSHALARYFTVTGRSLVPLDTSEA
jgi:hypothetical protein